MLAYTLAQASDSDKMCATSGTALVKKKCKYSNLRSFTSIKVQILAPEALAQASDSDKMCATSGIARMLGRPLLVLVSALDNL